MATDSRFQESHHAFSVAAHNAATDVLYSDNPSKEDISSLIELAHVAHWHWSHRADKTPQNISVALWLLSRSYAANGFGAQALSFAQNSLQTIENEDLLPSFYGYCHEALARAYGLLGDMKTAVQHIETANQIADTVPNPQAKAYLLDQISRITLPD